MNKQMNGQTNFIVRGPRWEGGHVTDHIREITSFLVHNQEKHIQYISRTFLEYS